MAWHACNIMNVHLKRKVTIKKLLGKEKSMSDIERQQKMAELNAALDGRS